MITIIERKIENVSFRLTVDETKNEKTTSGSPMLQMNDYYNLIAGVDTLQVIKAIANSTSLIEMKQNIKGIWFENEIKHSIETLIRSE